MVTSWIRYKKHKDLPNGLISLIEPYEKYIYIMQWIIERPTEPIPQYLMHNDFIKDYMNMFVGAEITQIVEKWIEKRPHEPVPDFL